MILTHLSVSDGVACFKTCKLFWQLSTKLSLWKEMYANTYGTDFVRKEFIRLFEDHQDFVLDHPAQWTAGESSKLVEFSYASFPHIPDRLLAIACATPAGNPRVRDAVPDGEDETEEEEKITVFEKSDLNVKYGFATLKNDHQSFTGLWRNSDICLGKRKGDCFLKY
jgi:hypothetical protein